MEISTSFYESVAECATHYGKFVSSTSFNYLYLTVGEILA